jgi:predicted adenylyl cyclase CyaB
MNELEAKIKLKSIEHAQVIVTTLDTLGAELISANIETNEFFDTSRNGLKKLGHMIRLRSFDTRDKCILTFKGKRLKGKFKNRLEMEVEISNRDEMCRILSVVGFKQNFSFQKKRLSFRFKECAVEIDCLPRLGYFCEVEGKNVKQISKVVKAIGLKDEECISDGYPSLLIAHAKKTKLGFRNITF